VYLRPTLEQAFSDIQIAIDDEHWLKLDGEGYHQYGLHDGSPTSGYPYISLYVAHFGDMMVKAKLNKHMHVIDVGCGAGDKLLRWQELCPGMRITGLEYEPVMAAAARYVSRPFPNINVICGDAFVHDYHKYDLIYMYCPIKNPFGQGLLQDHVIRSMRRGAKLCVSLQATHNPRTNSLFPKLGCWTKP
jgi:SAM-dependent methyltransferase